jgi:hypothetical protein
MASLPPGKHRCHDPFGKTCSTKRDYWTASVSFYLGKNAAKLLLQSFYFVCTQLRETRTAQQIPVTVLNASIWLHARCPIDTSCIRVTYIHAHVRARTNPDDYSLNAREHRRALVKHIVCLSSVCPLEETLRLGAGRFTPIRACRARTPQGV